MVVLLWVVCGESEFLADGCCVVRTVVVALVVDEMWFCNCGRALGTYKVFELKQRRPVWRDVLGAPYLDTYQNSHSLALPRLKQWLIDDDAVLKRGFLLIMWLLKGTCERCRHVGARISVGHELQHVDGQDSDRLYVKKPIPTYMPSFLTPFGVS